VGNTGIHTDRQAEREQKAGSQTYRQAMSHTYIQSGIQTVSESDRQQAHI